MILQIGKVPPPIGGISIHVQRLLKEFENDSINLELLDYSKNKNILEIIGMIWRCNIVHIHLSRKLHRLLFIFFFKLLLKKVIVTFHGEFDFKNKYDYLSLKYANIIIVLNKISYENAINIRSDSVHLIGAFIPPQTKKSNSLKQETKIVIEKFKSHYNNVFCTNAWNVVFDKDKREIYNGSLLVELFDKLKTSALLFSDPVGNYSNFLKNKYGNLPENIHFINYQHDFIDVINYVDAFIRPTTTDGDSLSVHEALYYNKDVIVSDVVDRPTGCILYHDIVELENKIKNFDQYKGHFKNYSSKDNIFELRKLYLEISN